MDKDRLRFCDEVTVFHSEIMHRIAAGTTELQSKFNLLAKKKKKKE